MARHRILLTWVLVLCGVAVGCGDDEVAGMDGPGAGGTSLDAGKEAASGGAAGAAGSGASGEAGMAGAAGQGGEAGTAGAAGAAGEGAAGEGAAGEGAAGTAGDGPDAGPDAPLCPDPIDEPNETEAAAITLGDVEVCQTKKVNAISAFDSDTDWYRFEGRDKFLGACEPAPSASVDAPDLRICVFAQCKSGSTSVVCEEGLAATSPSGRQGCCATGGAVTLQPSCSGSTQDASVFMRVDQPVNSVCVGYQVEYGF